MVDKWDDIVRETHTEEQLIELKRQAIDELAKTRAKDDEKIIRARASVKKREEALVREKVRLKNLERKAVIKERKLETRRKIIVGAHFMAKLSAEEMLLELDSSLTRPRDRELFGLPPILQDEDLVDTLPVNDPET